MPRFPQMPSPHTRPGPLSLQRCWDVALAPLKQIPMNLFIMYMAGNTISIFPAMMVCMMGWRPLQALMSLSASECSPRVGTVPWMSHGPLSVPAPCMSPSDLGVPVSWVSHSPKVHIFMQPSEIPHSPTVPWASHSPLGVPQSPGCPSVTWRAPSDLGVQAPWVSHSPLGVPQPPRCPHSSPGLPQPHNHLYITPLCPALPS